MKRTTSLDRPPAEPPAPSGERDKRPDPPLPLWRLYVLRFGYLFMGGGLAVVKWPLLFQRDRPWELMEGVVNCLLIALSIMALIGLRYPLRMLPILLFESAWKVLWLAVVALPVWVLGDPDLATRVMTRDLLFVVVILLVIPWDHVWSQYVIKRGDRWRASGRR